MPPANRHNPARAKSSQSLYSVHEFRAEFPDDESCLQWLWRERYAPDGEHAFCPKCEQVRSFKRYATAQRRQSWTCTACGHHVHPTAGTIYAKSSRPLTDWFYVQFLVASTRCGISAKQVERELGCNYRTAWRMLNLIHNRIMVQDDEKLRGEVEADETQVGGKMRESERRKREALGWDKKRYDYAKKTLVFAAVERKGRIRASVIPDSTSRTLGTKVRQYVLPGSVLFTDEWRGYDAVGKRYYRHRRIRHRDRIYVSGTTHTQTADGFFGLFKMGLRGTHHAVSKRWLQGYLNEWVWRYNRRFDGDAMFRQLLSRTAFQS